MLCTTFSRYFKSSKRDKENSARAKMACITAKKGFLKLYFVAYLAGDSLMQFYCCTGNSFS